MMIWVIEQRRVRVPPNLWRPTRWVAEVRWRLTKRLRDMRRFATVCEYRIAKYERAPEKTNVSAQRGKVTR